MGKSLHGRVVLVTGAATRIGRAIALDLAAHGCDLIAHYRTSRADAETLKEEVVAQGRKVTLAQADLSRHDEVLELSKRAFGPDGGASMLVNSASIFPDGGLLDLAMDELNANIQVNAFAPFELMRGLARSGAAGAAVNVLDTRIVDYDKKHVAYHLSKRMLFSLTRMAAAELAPTIRVCGVAPGLVLPPPGKDWSYVENLLHTNLLKTHGTKEQVAEAVRFLLTSPFITGQVIYVDGGRHLRGSFYGSE